MNLLALVDRTRFRPSLVVLDQTGPLARNVPADVEVVGLGQPAVRRALPALVRALRRRKPAIVFSTFTHVNVPLLATRRWFGDPRIVVREANMPSTNLRRMPWPWAFRRAIRQLYPRAAAVVATSERMVIELMMLGVPQGRLHLLANPVAVQALRAAAASPRRHPGHGLRFVTIGRLTRQKGYDRLLDALAFLPADTHCALLGEGPERESLLRQATQLGIAHRIAMPGFVGEPAPWVAGADALVMPSRFEGMPNAALEALALGTPVIATPEAGGLAEVEGVILAPAGAALVAAMAACKIDPTIAPRPSRLPARFRREVVASAFNSMLLEALERR